MWIWGCSELYDQSQARKGYSVSNPTKIHPRGSPLQRHLHSFSSAYSARNVFSILLPPPLSFLWNVIWCPLTCCILWKELKWIFCELACNLNYFAAFLHPGFARAISHETLNVALSFHMQYFRKVGCILRVWDISLETLLIWMDFGSPQLSEYPFGM